MSSTTFSDASSTVPGTAIVASWLNDVNTVAYIACGNGTAVPATNAQLLSNIGGAPLASPALTGTPTAPTASLGTNTTQLATTAFVQNNLSAPLQSLTASVASNALTVTYNGGNLFFRSGTLSTGTVTEISVSSISITVPSGATLGTSNGVASYLAIVVANNGGTPVLCIGNMIGGGTPSNLDEAGTISPTTISGSSNSSGALYSASSVAANSAYRVVGYIVITEATAGTWATAPTLVQGAGGISMSALQSLGFGQTWTDVSGSRSVGTTYFNTTPRPIFIWVSATQTVASQDGGFNVTTMSQLLLGTHTFGASSTFSISCIVLPGQAYNVAFSTSGTGNYNTVSWKELR